MSYSIRISHSFPPNYQNNDQYLAQVHSIIEKFNIDIDPNQVYYRSYKVEEEEEIRLLHKEWFPIEYSDIFFKSLSSRAIKAILAVYDFVHEGTTYPLIIACITYQLKYMDYDIARFTISDITGQNYGIYIVTFGVINEARGKGIAATLLNQVNEIAQEEFSIKYVYLDCIAYNDQGIKCYEKNGFVKIGSKKNHYNLFGERYDALVYCRYINGGQRPRTFTEIVCSCVTICGVPQKAYNKAKNTIYKFAKYRMKGSKYKPLQV